MRNRILVLHSGGMDLTVCLYQAQAEGHDVVSFGIDYGQRLSVELIFAARQCAARGIRRDLLSVSWAKPVRTIPQNRDVPSMRAGVSPAFLPARNVVFLSLACAHAAGIEANEVHVGLNCVDFSGYPDCTEEFVQAFEKMIWIASPMGPKIVAPLLSFSKPHIASLAKGLGITKSDTWSCYNPQIINGTVTPCMTCDACRLDEVRLAKL